jgi:uncharacterized protein with FMN-binding domain
MVVLGTVIGLAAVLSTRTTPAPLSMPAVTTTTSTTSSTSTPSGPTPPTTTPTTPSTTISPTAVRTATGTLVNYNFGTLAVQVTLQGATITKITVPTLNDGGNSYSQSVDSMSIPILTQEAMAAQSANIQSVSGASYTSAGFIQSLQSALTQLGI